MNSGSLNYEQVKSIQKCATKPELFKYQEQERSEAKNNIIVNQKISKMSKYSSQERDDSVNNHINRYNSVNELRQLNNQNAKNFA